MAGGFSVSGSGVEFEAKITPIVIISCIMAATGGLMFGYDVGISGIYLRTAGLQRCPNMAMAGFDVLLLISWFISIIHIGVSCLKLSEIPLARVCYRFDLSTYLCYLAMDKHT